MAQLQLHGITKMFPGIKALDNVSIELLAGEIHALCGENGAGKSTLMNILSGNLQPNEGKIVFNGLEVNIENPKRAFDLGISIVYQQLSLVDSLSVAENIFANQQPVNSFGLIKFKILYKNTADLLRQLELGDINPGTLVSGLSAAQKQMVEIAKALSRNPSVLILDEPTASITEKETKILFSILQKLKSKGVSIIYISHRLDEIFQIADRISILKDGTFQGTFHKQDLSKEELIRRMIGRDVKDHKRLSIQNKEVLLAVHHLTGSRFFDVSFQLHKGEILGLAGLVGAGRTEVARAIFGADEILSGEVLLHNGKLVIHHTASAIAGGIAYVPEERMRLGLFSEMSLQDNVVSASFSNTNNSIIYDASLAKQSANDAIQKFRIATTNVKQKVGNLSGGNQQKVVLAKWLLTNPDVLIMDEPTHGIDVGAKFEIYEIIRSLATDGKGILIISSDLPELIGLCDRIIVMKQGSIAGEMPGVEATEEKTMTLASN